MAKRLGKAIKLNITRPIDCDWNSLYDAYNDVSYKSSKILNYMMTNLYIWQQRKEEIKNEVGKYPSFKEFPMCDPYHEIRSMYYEIISSSIKQLIRTAQLRWKSDTKACYYAMDKSLPTYKKTYGFPMATRQYRIKKEDEKYIMYMSLYSKDVEYQRRFAVEIHSKKMRSSQKAILDRLINNEYKRGVATIKMNSKRKLQIIVTYTFEPKPIALDKDIICGIDLGLAIPVYCAISNSKQRWCSNDGFELEKFRRTVAIKRRQIQRQYPVSGRIGHGRKRALKPLEKLQNKVKNFRDNKYHLYSKRIIEFCLRNNAGVIQLENLSGLTEAKKSDGFLKDWAISELHSKIEYKAAEVGIEVRYINPRYTSQMCHDCGYISRDNRKKQSEFVCQKCGCSENADYNAAKNIAMADIEEVVANNLKNGNNDKNA